MRGDRLTFPDPHVQRLDAGTRRDNSHRNGVLAMLAICALCTLIILHGAQG